MSEFLLLVLWYKASRSLTFFSRYSIPQLVRTLTQAELSLRMRDFTWNVPPCSKFKYIFEFITLALTIHYDTFIGVRWRITGVYSWVPTKLNAKSSVNFQSRSKLAEFRRFRESEATKVAILLQKAHPCVNPRRLSHFVWRSVGLWPTRVT